MKVNHEKLRSWLNENGKDSLATLSLKTQISISVLQKLSADCYPAKLSENAQIRLSKFIKIPRKELFP